MKEGRREKKEKPRKDIAYGILLMVLEHKEPETYQRWKP